MNSVSKIAVSGILIGAMHLLVLLAPRASTVWQRKILEYYVHRQTVSEMKRTDRAKDWPFATALGVQMLVDYLPDVRENFEGLVI